MTQLYNLDAIVTYFIRELTRKVNNFLKAYMNSKIDKTYMLKETQPTDYNT